MNHDGLILGIESSCDETSIAVVKNGCEVRSNRISSQVDLHARYGGVVPEVASRRHIEVISPLVAEAMAEAQVGWEDLAAVATTRGPGLAGALLVGMMAAKAISWARGLPLIGVNHLAAHIWANKVADPQLELPFLCLLVSGGHTSLVVVRGPDDMREIGRTRDDAAGEAYDKIGRLLDLGYPGGPVIDRLAPAGDPTAFDFPRGLAGPGHAADSADAFDFSFSGLKTAVRRVVERHQLSGIPFRVEDVAASFQAAVVDVLAQKAVAATKAHGLGILAIAGGVAANRGLRSRLERECAANGWRFASPPPELCTDNAAMIAGLGHELWTRGHKDSLAMAATSRWPVGTAPPSP